MPDITCGPLDEREYNIPESMDEVPPLRTLNAVARLLMEAYNCPSGFGGEVTWARCSVKDRWRAAARAVMGKWVLTPVVTA
jgi:hypothetical protein